MTALDVISLFVVALLVVALVLAIALGAASKRGDRYYHGED